MNDTLKDLLFKKVIDLKKSKKAPLFKSQKALATEIIDNSNHYNNYVSVVSLLSKAFRKKNPVPLPKKLEAEIRTLIYKKVDNNNPVLNEIEKKFIEFTFEVADQYNSPSISYNEYIKEGIKFDIFSNNPAPLFWDKNAEAEFFMDMMIKRIWDGLSTNQIPKFKFYVGNLTIAKEVWLNIEKFCSHKKKFVWDGVYNSLNMLNKLGTISIYVVNSKKLIYPVTYIQHHNDKQPKIAFIASYVGAENVSVSHLSLVDTESWFNGIKDLLDGDFVNKKRIKSNVIYTGETNSKLKQYFIDHNKNSSNIYKDLITENTLISEPIMNSFPFQGNLVLRGTTKRNIASLDDSKTAVSISEQLGKGIFNNKIPVPKDIIRKRRIEAQRNSHLNKSKNKHK